MVLLGSVQCRTLPQILRRTGDAILIRYPKLSENNENRPRHLRDILVTYRNGRWRCAVSPDGRFTAYMDHDVVYLYDTRAAGPMRPKSLYRADTVDLSTGRLAFSPKNTYFAYTDAADGLTVYDLKKQRVVWQGKLPLPASEAAGVPQISVGLSATCLQQQREVSGTDGISMEV